MASNQASLSPDSPTVRGFYDLPAEIRDQILEAALIRGSVALCPLRDIRERVPHWNHSPPVWGLLKAVSHRMQLDASQVVFSASDTFFLPAGETDHFAAVGSGGLLQRVQNLDCAFDRHKPFEDDETILRMAFDLSWRVDKTKPFWNKTPEQQRMLMHRCGETILWDRWLARARVLEKLHLRLLRLDFSNAHCLHGCCRPVYQFLCSIFEKAHSFPRVERLEIVGPDEIDIRLFWMNHEDLQNRVFFVEALSCTCKVSLNIQLASETFL